MGRTIAKRFFHPYEVPSKRNKQKIELNNWEDENKPIYYDSIPIYFQKIYRSIDINLETECKSIIPTKQCIVQIVVLDKFLEEFKEYVKNSPIYESVEYNIKYDDKDIPDLLDLVISHKYFMNYLHIPKRSDGLWFSEARFFSYEEIKSTPFEKILKKLEEFVKIKEIDYMDFLEEWVGLIFHLCAEFLLFKKKIKVIFYSCDKCYRPGLLIKEKVLKNEDDDENKIWGTINIVDTIIYNMYNKLNFSNISKVKEKSKNNIIYYDESFYNRTTAVYNDYETFKNETEGAFILITKELIWDNLIKELKEKNSDYVFDLIITGSTAKKILTKINNLGGDKFIDKICIYTLSRKKYQYLAKEFPKIKGIYVFKDEIINFIHSENKQNNQIYQTVKLITFKDYTNQYNVLHKMISSHYGQTDDNCFKIAISYLKDYLLWYPKLKLNLPEGEVTKTKIESLLETLQKFQGLNDNETNIIELYTEECNSYYQDFNNWLYTLDPLAIQKTSWFIATVIYSLNKYSEKENKGLKKATKLYRGLKMNLIDLLYYEAEKNQLICYPSFTSTSLNKNIAIGFSKKKLEYQYETIITINYNYNEGFVPTAVEIYDISQLKYEKECIFLPYSFFKIKNVEIDHINKKGTIELDSIGRKTIFEEKLKDGKKLEYNDKGFMEIIECN